MKGLQDKKILVAGSEGFLGRLAALRLLELGASVWVVDWQEKGCANPIESPGACHTVIPEDLNKPGCLNGGFEAVLFLEHPVILPNTGVDKHFMDIQMSGLVSLLNLAGCQSCYFVYASSVAVYGRPRYLPIDEKHPLEPCLMYGSVKLAGEYLCRSAALEHGFFYTVLRYGDIYGPGNMLSGEPAQLLRSAIEGNDLAIKGTGDQVKSYIYTNDAVEATVSLLDSKPANRTFNLAGNEYISISELANQIRKNYSPKSNIIKMNKELDDEIDCCIDSTKAEELLRFSPKYDLFAGLAETYQWLLSNL